MASISMESYRSIGEIMKKMRSIIKGFLLFQAVLMILNICYEKTGMDIILGNIVGEVFPDFVPREEYYIYSSIANLEELQGDDLKYSHDRYIDNYEPIEMYTNSLVCGGEGFEVYAYVFRDTMSANKYFCTVTNADCLDVSCWAAWIRRGYIWGKTEYSAYEGDRALRIVGSSRSKIHRFIRENPAVFDVRLKDRREVLLEYALEEEEKRRQGIGD